MRWFHKTGNEGKESCVDTPLVVKPDGGEDVCGDLSEDQHGRKNQMAAKMGVEIEAKTNMGERIIRPDQSVIFQL